MGKGSNRRPTLVDQATADRRWDKIFNTDINICDTCIKEFATCDTVEPIFGEGFSGDNVVNCTSYTAKNMQKDVDYMNTKIADALEIPKEYLTKRKKETKEFGGLSRSESYSLARDIADHVDKTILEKTLPIHTDYLSCGIYKQNGSIKIGVTSTIDQLLKFTPEKDNTDELYI